MRWPEAFVAKLCVIAALSAGLIGCSQDSGKSNDSSTGPAGRTTSITEADIREAMEQDDLARFAGQQIELKGVVQAVGADGGGHLLLEELRLNTVDDQPWAKVLPGQEATLVGTYTEERGLKFDIANVSGERPVLTAVELTKEFVADKAAINAKYQEKWLDLSGTVSEVKVGEADIVQISVAGDGDNYAICSFFPEGQKPQLDAVKVGDNIRFVGAYMTQTSFDTPILNFCLFLNE